MVLTILIQDNVGKIITGYLNRSIRKADTVPRMVIRAQTKAIHNQEQMVYRKPIWETAELPVNVMIFVKLIRVRRLVQDLVLPNQDPVIPPPPAENPRKQLAVLAVELVRGGTTGHVVVNTVVRVIPILAVLPRVTPLLPALPAGSLRRQPAMLAGELV